MKSGLASVLLLFYFIIIRKGKLKQSSWLWLCLLQRIISNGKKIHTHSRALIQLYMSIWKYYGKWWTRPCLLNKWMAHMDYIWPNAVVVVIFTKPHGLLYSCYYYTYVWVNCRRKYTIQCNCLCYILINLIIKSNRIDVRHKFANIISLKASWKPYF